MEGPPREHHAVPAAHLPADDVTKARDVIRQLRELELGVQLRVGDGVGALCSELVGHEVAQLVGSPDEQQGLRPGYVVHGHPDGADLVPVERVVGLVVVPGRVLPRVGLLTQDVLVVEHYVT